MRPERSYHARLRPLTASELAADEAVEHVMPAPETPPPQWPAQQRIESSFRQQSPQRDVAALHFEPQLPPQLQTPQLAPQPGLQPSLSGLPPGDPITPHTHDGYNSSGSDAGDSIGGAGARRSSQGQSSLDGSSPHLAGPDASPHMSMRHRTQPSWPHLSTSGDQRI